MDLIPAVHLSNNPLVHENSADCWCKPYILRKCMNSVQVWVHRDPEGAEPPVESLMEAIVQAAFHGDEEEDEK